MNAAEVVAPHQDQEVVLLAEADFSGSAPSCGEVANSRILFLYPSLGIQ